MLGTVPSARDIGWTDQTGSPLPGSFHSDVNGSTGKDGFGHQKGAGEALLAALVGPTGLRRRHLRRDLKESEPGCPRGDFPPKGPGTRRQDFGETERRPLSLKHERPGK